LIILSKKTTDLGLLEFIIVDKKNTWYAKWADEDGNSCKKLYSSNKHGFVVVKQLAIDQRSRVERELPHYANTLGLNANGHQ